MSNQERTPRFANFLLGIFCRSQHLDEVKGDLEENYLWRIKEKGLFKAKLRYFLDVFSAIRFMRCPRQIETAFSRSMLFSFIKSSFRNFKRNRVYTFLNLFGLALGMAAALFILEYVSDELDYDQFEQSDDMYRISQDFVKNNERLYKTAVTAAPLAPALISDLPKVEKAARLFDYTRTWEGKNIFIVPDDPEKNFIEPDAYFADPAILDLFDLKVVSGNSKLDEPNTILFSTDMARKYFGSIEEAIGQVIQFSSVKDKPSLVITGIYEHPDFNMQVRPSALVSYVTLNNEVQRQGLYQMWGVNSCLTYVKLQEGTDLKEFETDLANLLLKYNPLETQEDRDNFRIGSLLVTPIKDLHLNSTYPDEVGAVGNATTVRILIIIAIFIVIIAWVNYINLATAHSLNRLREVGVRKVMGAKKEEIVIQFFTEAFIMNVLAFILGIGVVLLGQQMFNQFVDKALNLEEIDLLRFGLPVGVIFLFGVVLSGLYPLTILSSIGAVAALKGKSKGSWGSRSRRGLIVFQFLSSSLLIIATVAINRQLDFMTSQDKGANLNQILVLDGPTVKDSDRQLHHQKTELLISRLNELSNVLSVGVSNSIPGKSILQSQTISRENNNDSETQQYELVSGSEYLKILDLRFVAGEGFNTKSENGGTREIVLSESATKKMGFPSPGDAIGELVYRWFRGVQPSPVQVVGVVEDYHHEALDKPMDPMVFYSGNSWDYHYLVKLQSNNSAATIAEIEKAYTDVFPANPVNYYFLDQFFERQHQSEEVNSKVFTVFAIIAILVACLGLFGLSSFMALQRTKEIGVRKVLGAGAKSVFLLLAKDLILLAALGFLLAAPLGYFGIKRWLEGFAYHISISTTLFFVPLLMILVLALLAIGPRVMKTALMNPVKSLRHE